MSFNKSFSFLGLRDLSVGWVSRMYNLPADAVLQIKRDEINIGEDKVLILDEKSNLEPDFLSEYFRLSKELFPDTRYLFPTIEGQIYAPVKFHERMNDLMKLVKISGKSNRLSELPQRDFQKLIDLRFSIQRFQFQSTMAVTLCSHLGLRPSEVGNLIVSDIDFGNKIIKLRDTKSQEDQELPLLSYMTEPFHRFVSHLRPDAPLFIRPLSGKTWGRKDVTNAISEWAQEHSMSGHVNSRMLRASLGSKLATDGAPPALVAMILRHKDPATALRHYNKLEIEKARYFLEKVNIQTERHSVYGGLLTQEFGEFYASRIMSEQ